MRKALCLNALVALAAGSPIQPRQDIDFDLVDSAPEIPTYTIGNKPQTVTFDLHEATSLATNEPLPPVKRSELDARAACQPQPLGAGPVPDPDTPEAFLAYSDFATQASNAATPSGYAKIFSNLQGSTEGYGYMGHTILSSYDTALCASKCDAITGCTGFNLYYERDPTVDPGETCLNPPSTTMIKCVWWGGAVARETATNRGQWRRDFHVVISGSNGYQKTTFWDVPGFTGTKLGSKAINAPLDCNRKDTFMGSKIFTSSYFDPKLCSAACASQNKYNIAHPPSNGKPKICKFFNTYMMYKNGEAQGQYCSLYTQKWDASKATNSGQWRGSDHYTIDYSFSFSNDTSPGLPVCPSDISYLQQNGGEFCTSYNQYSMPTTTVTVPATITSTTATFTDMTTATTTVFADSTTTTTITATITPSNAAVCSSVRKRDVEELNTDYSIAIETFSTNFHKESIPTSTPTAVARRAVETPASISNWESASISEACSQVATGTFTATATTTQTVFTATTTSAQTTATVSVPHTATFTVPAPVLATSFPVVPRGSRVDDAYYGLDLPFAVSIYGASSTHVYLSSNGLLSIGAGSAAYTNSDIPSSYMPAATLFGLWDDLMVYDGTDQGIYYAISGQEGGREITFEWYLSHFSDRTKFFHFTITVYENQPGVFLIEYHQVSDQGASASIGAQSLSEGRSLKWSFNQAGAVRAGQSLLVDTRAGTMTMGTICI